MKKMLNVTLAVFLVALSLPAWADEVHMTNDFSMTSYNVHGAPERSFYPKHKTRYLYEGELDFVKDLYGGNQFYTNFYYRSTDDTLIDQQDGFSVEKFYMGVRNENYDVVAGDYYAFFSEYSLSNAVKGGKLEIKNINLGNVGSLKFITLGGLDTPRWEDLWENRCDDSQSIRYVWGERIESRLFENQLMIAFNYAGAWDDWSTIPVTGAPLFVQVGSIDWKADIGKYLSLRGETALSYSDTDKRVHDVEPKFDDAFKAGVDFKSDYYELSGEYSRVGAHFSTTGGFAPQDLESLLFDGIAYMPWNISIVHYLHMDQDNLTKVKSTTTKQINPGVKANFRLPWQVKAVLGWDMRKRYSTDDLTGDLTNVISAGLSKDFGYCYLSGQYYHTVIENYKNAAQDRYHDAVEIVLDGDFKIKEIRFYWNCGSDIQVEQYNKIGNCKLDVLLSLTGGLKAVFPSTLTFDSKITWNDSDYYINETDSNVNKYHLSVSRDIIKDLVLSFNYDQADHYYADGEGDYFEIVMTGKLLYKF